MWQQAVLAEWAGAGIRLNAIAPGVIRTPLVERQLAVPAEAARMRSMPQPLGEFGDAGHWPVPLDPADRDCYTRRIEEFSPYQ